MLQKSDPSSLGFARTQPPANLAHSLGSLDILINSSSKPLLSHFGNTISRSANFHPGDLLLDPVANPPRPSHFLARELNMLNKQLSWLMETAMRVSLWQIEIQLIC